MSVLFGAFDGADAPGGSDTASALHAMGQRALRAVPPGAKLALWDDGHGAAALGCCGLGATMPQLATGAGLVVALRGQFDNRDELQRRFGDAAAGFAAGGSANAPGDAALLLAMVRRLGIDSLDLLYGDWSCAIWDAAEQRVVLARDATGHSPVFWWHDGHRLRFASSLPVLLVAPEVPRRPDPHWIAGLLTVFHDPTRPGATAFEGIHALPPGHLLVVQRGQATLRAWWRPEALPVLYDTPRAELEARFVDCFDQAVHNSLRCPGGPAALMLSGGLDSGAVAAAAAPWCAAAGQTLATYVHLPRIDLSDRLRGRTAHEGALATATARHVGLADPVGCITEQPTPVGAIEQWLDMAGAPSHAVANWYWLLDLAQRAAADGAQTLLTGQAGNATVSFNGQGDLWPRLRRLELRAVLRELQQEQGGWRAAVRQRLVKPPLRPAWHRAQARLRPRTGGWVPHGLLNPALAASLDLEGAMRRAGHDASLSTVSAWRARDFRLGRVGGADNGTAAWSELGTHTGLNVRDPTRDRRVVELCWQLPDELYWSHGLQRGLVRHTLRDRLPASVLGSTRKGQQSSDLCARLHASCGELLDLVDRVGRHPQVEAWIDMPRLRRWADTISHPDGHGSDDAAGALGRAHHALRALAAAAFISRQA